MIIKTIKNNSRIILAIKAIKKFNPVIEGPDSFISKFMRKVKKLKLNSNS